MFWLTIGITLFLLACLVGARKKKDHLTRPSESAEGVPRTFSGRNLRRFFVL